MAAISERGQQWVDRIDQLAAWIEAHWLAMLLALFWIWVLVPFLAPVAMATGHERLGRLIYTMYIPFCHQLPQRSWFLFGEKLTYTHAEIYAAFPTMDPWRLRFFYGTEAMGWKVAWSDRMISFYGFLPVFGTIYALLRRRRPVRPVRWPLIALALLPLAVDGGTHFINDLLYGIGGQGFRDTNAWLAALTGNRWPWLYAGDHMGTFNWWARLITGILGAWSLGYGGLSYLGWWVGHPGTAKTPDRHTAS